MQIIKSVGAFKKKDIRVFIAIPTVGPLCAETAVSLFSGKEALLAAGIESELVICAYGCHVDDQRNMLVKEFLESTCNVFVFIDSDVQFDAEDLVRLIHHDRDVVAGVYPYKQDDTDFPVMFIPGEIWSDEAGLIEVKGVPTGFLKIKRSVFEKLYEVVSKYVARRVDTPVYRIPLVFERVMTNGARYGGDYEFCRKWRKIGGKIHVDPEMYFAHIGSKSYSGSLGNHLRKKSGLIDDYIVSLCEKMKTRAIETKDFGRLVEAWDNGLAVPMTDMLVILHDLAHDGDGPILETGTGVSSLIFGSSGRPVTSLENHTKWGEKTQKFLDKCGFDNVKIKYAPMVNGFYDVNLNGNYKLILADGPARLEGGIRKRLVEKLDRLSEGCVVVVDDVEARDAVNAFTEKFGIEFMFYGRFAIGQYKGAANG